MERDEHRRLLARLHAALHAENSWTRWKADGFVWWPCRLALHVTIDRPPDTDAAAEELTVRGRIPVIANIRSNQQRAADRLLLLRSIFAGLVLVELDARARTLHIDVTSVIRPSNDADIEVLSERFIEQLAVAEKAAPRLAMMFAARIADFGPPSSVKRRQPAAKLHSALASIALDRRAALLARLNAK